MKSGCKPKKTLRMAVGGAFSSPLQDAYDKQAKDFARVPTTTTPVGGDFGPGRNPRDPNNRPVATPGGNELIHTMGPENMGMRPAVGLDHTMASTPQQSLRSATAPTLTPSALEQRLNDRMNAGTLTIRGAGMLQGMEDSRRQADMQRYGIDTQANTSQYSTDKQWDSNRYSTDQQLKGSMYGHDMSYKGQLANIDAQKYIAGMNNDTNLKQIDAGIYNNTMSNNTQNSIADKNQQTALANLQNQYDMNQQNINASVFNNLASRSRSFGLRNGGEIHAANGFMPGGYAERGRSIKWLSPYDGIKAQAALADMDLKQDYMRAQTEAIRAQAERADRGPSQGEVNATRMAEDQARRRFAWEEEDRTTRNKMTQTAFDTKLRNDAQDRALAMQDRAVALQDAQGQQVQDNIRYVDSLNAAQRAGIAAHNREQDAMGNAWLAKRQAATQDQALIDRRSEDGDAALALGMLRSGGYGLRNGGEIHAVAGFNAQRIIDQGLDIGRGNFGMRRQLQDYNIGMGQQNFDFAQRQYADSQARTGRLDEFAKQQYGDTLARTGRLDDFTKQQYADTRIDRFNAIAEEQRRYDAAQRVDAERYGQAQRRADMAESLQFQRDNEAAERAKREESYLNQARADARSRQLEGDFYAREDRARNYALLQDANKRLNENRRGPMSLDPRFTHSNGMPRFGLRHGGSPAIDNGLGGAVPGTGKGDKIPAMYEPNEFVVSNDMLDAEPELRDHLRDLRERVLAAKGMTVAEADAKAMGGGRRLRADVGWGYDLEDLNQRRARDFGLTEEEAADIERKLQEKRAQGEAIRNIVANDAGPADLNQRRARDFGLTEEGAAGIDAKLQAKQARGAAIRNAVAASADADEAVVAKNDGVAKIAALNQRAADADAKVRTDTSRGVYRDVDPTMSPELAASREEGRRRDLRSYADAQSAALDAGKSAPALPKSLRDTGNIYKTVDDQGRVTYSGGVVKAGAKFIGGDGEEFTPGGSVEYAKPGTRFAATPDGKGVAFTPVSEDKNQRAADIAQNAVDIAKWKAKEAAEAPLRAKEQERQDMIGEVRSMEQAAMSGDNRAAALLPGARNLLADRLKTDALERSEAEKNAAHIKGIEIQTKGTRDTAEAKRLIERENELLIAKALDKAGGNSEATVDLLSKAGRGDLAETLSKRVTSDNDRRTKDYENMIGEFKKLGVRDAGTGEEIPGGAEMAAQLLLKRTGGKIIDADKRAEMMREAILEARLLHGMQQKARGRNSSLRTWFAGDDNIPTDLPASSAPKKLSPWDGAWTFGGVEAGDYDYGGGRYLPATVGRDAIEHAKKLAKRKAGIE